MPLGSTGGSRGHPGAMRIGHGGASTVCVCACVPLVPVFGQAHAQLPQLKRTLAAIPHATRRRMRANLRFVAPLFRYDLTLASSRTPTEASGRGTALLTGATGGAVAEGGELLDALMFELWLKKAGTRPVGPVALLGAALFDA